MWAEKVNIWLVSKNLLMNPGKRTPVWLKKKQKNQTHPKQTPPTPNSPNPKSSGYRLLGKEAILDPERATALLLKVLRYWGNKGNITQFNSVVLRKIAFPEPLQTTPSNSTSCEIRSRV